MLVMNRKWIHRGTKSGSNHTKSRHFSHEEREQLFASYLCWYTEPPLPILEYSTQSTLSNFIATTYTLHNSHFSVFASPNTSPSFDNIKVKGRRCIGQWPRPTLGIPQLMSCRLFTICTFLPEIINFLSLHQRERKTYPLSCVWSLGLCKITERWRNAN